MSKIEIWDMTEKYIRETRDHTSARPLKAMITQPFAVVLTSTKTINNLPLTERKWIPFLKKSRHTFGPASVRGQCGLRCVSRAEWAEGDGAGRLPVGGSARLSTSGKIRYAQAPRRSRISSVTMVARRSAPFCQTSLIFKKRNIKKKISAWYLERPN